MPVDRIASSPRHEFLWFFVGGAVAIVLLKFFFENVLFAPFVACGLVILYAFGVWDRVDRRPRFDDAGDYAYYLGFLYTLVSMAVSLYQVSGGLGNDLNVIRTVVSGFGVAIASTICGMAARVYLGRGETDLGGTDASAHLDLAAAGRRLRAELDYTVAEFEGFRARVRGQLESLAEEAAAGTATTQEHADSAERSLRAFEDAIAGVAAGLSERAEELSRSATSLADLDTAATRLTGGVESVAEAARQGGEAISAGVREVEGALAGQAKRIEGVDFRKAFEERMVAPAAERLRAAVATIETNIQRLDLGWEKRREAVERTGQSADRLAESLSRVAAESQNLSVAVAKMTEAATRLRTSEEHISRVGEELREQRREAAEGFRAFRDGIQRAAETIASVNEQLIATQTELADTLQKKRARRRFWRVFSS